MVSLADIIPILLQILCNLRHVDTDTATFYILANSDSDTNTDADANTDTNTNTACWRVGTGQCIIIASTLVGILNKDLKLGAVDKSFSKWEKMIISLQAHKWLSCHLSIT